MNVFDAGNAIFVEVEYYVVRNIRSVLVVLTSNFNHWLLQNRIGWKGEEGGCREGTNPLPISRDSSLSRQYL